MNAYEIRSIVGTLVDLLDAGERHIEAIRALAQMLAASGVQAEIEEDDDDDLDERHLSSLHTLRIDGKAVADWERFSVGGYGLNGAHPDAWVSDTDTAVDRGVPYPVAVILDAFGLVDSIPSVPEPEQPFA